MPLPVEIVSGAAAVGHEGWFPPSRTHPLPVEVVAGGGPGGGIPDAPDAQLYGRRGPPAATWDLVTTGTGVPEAPTDGTSNVRRNGGWTNIIDGGTY